MWKVWIERNYSTVKNDWYRGKDGAIYLWRYKSEAQKFADDNNGKVYRQ